MKIALINKVKSDINLREIIFDNGTLLLLEKQDDIYEISVSLDFRNISHKTLSKIADISVALAFLIRELKEPLLYDEAKSGKVNIYMEIDKDKMDKYIGGLEL